MKPLHQETETFNGPQALQTQRPLRFAIRKQLIGLIVCVAGVVGTNSAYAACQWYRDGKPGAPAKITSNVTMSPTTIQFPSNAGYGSVIASATYTVPGPAGQGPNVSCTAGTRTYTSTPFKGGQDYIFATGVPGVGIRINRYQGAVSQNYFPASQYTNTFSFQASGTNANGWTIVFELVTTASSSTGGNVAAGLFVKEAIDGLDYHDIGLANSIRILPGGDSGGGGPTDPVIIPPPSTARCYPEYSLSRDYTLKPIKSAELKGIGSTTGEISFRVFIACDNASVVPSYFTFTDAADAGNRTSIFKLSPGSKAKDVSIQMTLAKDGTPVKFGAESRQKNNPNSVLLNKSGSVGSVDLKARYIQTGPSPTPGKIQASAYVTYSLP